MLRLVSLNQITTLTPWVVASAAFGQPFHASAALRLSGSAAKIGKNKKAETVLRDDYTSASQKTLVDVNFDRVYTRNRSSFAYEFANLEVTLNVLPTPPSHWLRPRYTGGASPLRTSRW